MGPWRKGVAVVNLPVRPAELTHPEMRPSLLLRDAGFEVHTVTRGDIRERDDLDGTVRWVEPGTLATARRIVSLRPELLFVESSTYGATLGSLARRSWIRNPVPAADARIQRLQRSSLRTFDAVTFTNPAQREPWTFSRSKWADLPYPVDVAWWAEPIQRRESWWTDRGWPVPTGPVLVCNSCFERRKRHEELLEWLAPLLNADRSIVLVLFGHRWNEPDVWEMVRARRAELGISDQVRATDWISYAEIRELMAWTSLTIINSRHETQCLAVYESLAAGVPALISAIPELTSQFPNVPAHHDGAELRANVRRVLGDHAFATSLIDSSSEQVAWSDVRHHDEVFQATLERLLGGRLPRVPSGF